MGFVDHILPHTEYMCGFGCAAGDGEKCGVSKMTQVAHRDFAMRM